MPIYIYREFDARDAPPVAIVTPQSRAYEVWTGDERDSPLGRWLERVIRDAVQDEQVSLLLPDGTRLTGPAARYTPHASEWAWLVQTALATRGLRCRLEDYRPLPAPPRVSRMDEPGSLEPPSDPPPAKDEPDIDSTFESPA